MVIFGKFPNNESMGNYAQKEEFKEERKELGENIAHIRQVKKMTQEDLADQSNMNVSYLAKIENGYVNTTVRYLIKIARGLRVKVKDLFNF